MIVDPPWSGKTGHNQHGDPLPYTAAQSLAQGDFPEGYAVHHLGRVLPADEQPQPGTPRSAPRDPVLPLAELETPLASVDPSAPDLQALGDYMSARLSGHSAQDALDVSATEGQAPGDARQSLARAAAWYQSHHASPQDPAAAAALIELIDPVARLQALGSWKAAVSPPVPPVQKATRLPNATWTLTFPFACTSERRGHVSRAQDEHAIQLGPGLRFRQCSIRYPRGSTTLPVEDTRAAPGSGNPRNGPPSGPLRRSVLRPSGCGGPGEPARRQYPCAAIYRPLSQRVRKSIPDRCVIPFCQNRRPKRTTSSNPQYPPI